MIVKLPGKDKEYRWPAHFYCIEIKHQPERPFSLKEELVVVITMGDVRRELRINSGKVKNMHAMFFYMIADLDVDKAGGIYHDLQ